MEIRNPWLASLIVILTLVVVGILFEDSPSETARTLFVGLAVAFVAIGNAKLTYQIQLSDKKAPED
jgi:hypothetical protein